MIIVDTNIISEVMRREPLPIVLEWLNSQVSLHLYVSTITLAEIGFGLRVLPEGQRRQQLKGRFESFVEMAFEERVLDFTSAAAVAYSDIMGRRKEMGRPMSLCDGQIAGIAIANQFAIATRNIKDFAHCGIELVNPFE
ncbi:MAG: type II toxin-antitoxin system VapC family toxin [Gammaproteobacteria bacterium]|nr:type II toxin-antitoxin system VapC family toxin [Gammaproteobacteria bacterium]